MSNRLYSEQESFGPYTSLSSYFSFTHLPVYFISNYYYLTISLCFRRMCMFCHRSVTKRLSGHSILLLICKVAKVFHAINYEMKYRRFVWWKWKINCFLPSGNRLVLRIMFFGAQSFLLFQRGWKISVLKVLQVPVLLSAIIILWLSQFICDACTCNVIGRLQNDTAVNATVY